VFSLTVRRNFMIAHSLPREAFGPAQGLHGATFVTEVTFRRRELNDDAIVLDIGAAGVVLDEVLEGLNYKNLDEHPDFAGKLSTTEALARYIADAVAAQVRAGNDGQELAGLDVTLRETPDAWAGFSLDFDAR
jgi:6-pyruvoyltetrahydropterin/6-carboxytetrahydropterin synthase